ncbi:MAG: Na+/H+ antiporter NhaA [Bacteroidetes bacterium]|nr:Na+/H+ antiporter NhaA [Bacteroidota bacterium]
MPKKTKIIKQLLTPFEKFLKIESFGGIILFFVTIVALIWANSSFSDSYNNLWNYNFDISIMSLELSKPLILWINDGLMAIFFFLIGLEIKRELLVGELNSLKKASLPIFAAIGGVLIPIALFFVLNNNSDTLNGWGIPMATDIAFTLAILQLLGNRVPISLKIFLTAFAIVDDLVAVLVIAFFYSAEISWNLIGLSFIPFLILILFNYYSYFNKFVVFILSVIIWLLFLKSGIHPTIAGVLIAFTVPISQKIEFRSYAKKLKEITSDICTKENSDVILSKQQIYLIDDLQDWTEKVQSPLQQLEHNIHSWVAYLIIPVFALANAGVSINQIDNLDANLTLAIALSLLFGKSIGVSLFSYIGLKLKYAELPDDINFKQIIGVSFLAGVGFTMSIFVANLAFTDNPIYIESSKVGIILGSVVSGILGFFILKMSSKKQLK